MAVDWLILEEDDVAHLGDSSLILPGNCESSPGVLLVPERIVEVEDDPPPGDLVLHSYVRVNFVSVTLTEAQKYMIGG